MIFMAEIKITSPDGETLIIRGNTICVKKSPEKCIKADKKLIELIMDYVWHNKDWSVEKVE
jgi:hypothetical protein